MTQNGILLICILLFNLKKQIFGYVHQREVFLTNIPKTVSQTLTMGKQRWHCSCSSSTFDNKTRIVHQTKLHRDDGAMRMRLWTTLIIWLCEKIQADLEYFFPSQKKLLIFPRKFLKTKNIKFYLFLIRLKTNLS